MDKEKLFLFQTTIHYLLFIIILEHNKRIIEFVFWKTSLFKFITFEVKIS